MPPTPITASYKVHIRQSNTLTSVLHTSEIFASAQTNVLDPSGYDLGVGAAAIAATTAIANFVTKYKANFHSSTTIVDWILFTFVTPNWIPVYSNAIGVVGTSTVAPTKAHITTMTFRTATGYKLAKIQMAEDQFTTLFHTSSSIDAATTALKNDIITYSSGTSGGWIVQRNNSPLSSFRFYTGDFSRRLRKMYGLL